MRENRGIAGRVNYCFLAEGILNGVMKNGEWYLEGSPFSITEALVPMVELNKIS